MFTNFNLDKVKLTDKYFAHRRNLVKKYIADFDIDRLMHTFRLNAGIQSEAEPLGGWEYPECGIRGHFAGHFLSACARFSYADNDNALSDKASRIIDIMEQCARADGYLSAFEEKALDILEFEENRHIWAPYYTLHKILQGLVDCYIYLHNDKALKLAVNLTHYIRRRFEKLSYWKIDGILRCTKVNPANEFGGLGDVLYSLYDITKDTNILNLAKLFDRDYFIDNLAAGNDVLDNLHANTHLPMVIAAMHRYNITGEEKYKTGAINFYDYLTGRTFANGNSSSKASAFIKGGVSEKSEHWGAYGKLGDALTSGESESCCAHNTEKILQQLFEWSGAVEFLDHMEILKYNAILNSASNKTGLSQYHQPMGSGAVKKFSGLYDTFWCCSASGIEAMSELQKNIWFKGEDVVLLNTFISSTVVWEEKDVKITQTSDYPDTLTSTLVIETSKPTQFKLILKESSVKALKLNSNDVDLIRDSGYIVIQRMFNNLDKIEIEINATLHLEPLQGSDELKAVMYGKILLAELGPKQCLSGITEHELLSKLIKLDDQSKLEFVTTNDEGNEIKFIPLFMVEDEKYSVYMNFTNQPQNSQFSAAKDGSAAYSAS